MAKFRSPGQKRKRNIRTGCILLVIIGLALAYFIKGPGQVAAIKLQESHQSAKVAIVDLREVEEEYRNRKGRKKYRNVVFLDYRYEAEGQTFNKTEKFSENDFFAIRDVSIPEVWYELGKAESAKFAARVKADATRTSMQRLINVGMIVIPTAFVLNILLSFFFGREPKGFMPEGFYTENSWLDIEDNYLVVLNNEHIDVISFDNKSADNMQKLYQDNASFETILAEVKIKTTKISLDSIVNIESDHYKDTINIDYMQDGEEESRSLEFLSATVKAHALEKIAAKLSPDLTIDEKQFTRFNAAKWRLLGAGIFVGLTFYFSETSFVLVIGLLISSYLLKSSIARLFDPTHRTRWYNQSKTNS